jgi:hypothetical protein
MIEIFLKKVYRNRTKFTETELTKKDCGMFGVKGQAADVLPVAF